MGVATMRGGADGSGAANGVGCGDGSLATGAGAGASDASSDEPLICVAQDDSKHIAATRANDLKIASFTTSSGKACHFALLISYISSRIVTFTRNYEALSNPSPLAARRLLA
ncbi:hypothetical protein GJ699_17935 [Duganella sp. FT80W]|uniref:Uncharacterized protein n=1 Tax=Duganella guangzhouensis TaxID=2666084 RepID=A0A6I2L117_9BURK|nr:hypothetical protein [Duganella guangzhouensis]MRW91878.1 hypothetical protein [Duganella guangzhouensis]